MKRSRASSSGICRARKLSGSQPYRTLPTSKTTAVAGKASALARLEAAVGLVDDVGAAPAADHAAVAVARLQGFERVADLHGLERLPDICLGCAGKARRPPSGGAPSSQAAAGPDGLGGSVIS